MASVFKVAFEFSVFDSANRILRTLGDRFIRTTITPTLGVVFDTLDVIADNYGQDTLWVAGQGGIDTFEYMFFLSDVDVYLEVANTVPTPDERSVVFVKGGIPLVLPGGKVGGLTGSTRFVGSVLVSGTDYDNINEIRVHNDAADGEGDATVRLILVG